MAIRKNGTVYYLFCDHLGSTSLTTNANRAKVSELRYNPAPRYTSGVLREGEVRYAWTASLSTSPAYELTKYTYTGQYSHMDDPSTAGVTEDFGLMFYNARWLRSVPVTEWRGYDPSLGRFAQADTIIPMFTQGVQAWDRYAYVNNAPTRFTDPSGHRACSDIDENGNCLTEDDLTEIYENTPQVVTLGTPGTNNKDKGLQIFGNYYAGCNYLSCTQVTIYPLSGKEGDNLQVALYQTALGEPVDYVIGDMTDVLIDNLLENFFEEGSKAVPVVSTIFNSIDDANN